MKVIIAGSRNITNYEIVLKACADSEFPITEIVSGGARGVDSVGEQIAKDFNIPLVVFEAEWDKYREAAGHIRNEQMANYADALVAIWDGRSPGTKNMIYIAKKLKKKVYVSN